MYDRNIICTNSVTAIIKKKALSILDRGDRPKHLTVCDLYKLDVGLRHRMVSKDKISWKLMTHEQYNKYITKGK